MTHASTQLHYYTIQNSYTEDVTQYNMLILKPCLTSRTSISDTSSHSENIGSTETEQLYLCRVLHFTRQNLMLKTTNNN